MLNSPSPKYNVASGRTPLATTTPHRPSYSPARRKRLPRRTSTLRRSSLSILAPPATTAICSTARKRSSPPPHRLPLPRNSNHQQRRPQRNPTRRPTRTSSVSVISFSRRRAATIRHRNRTPRRRGRLPCQLLNHRCRSPARPALRPRRPVPRRPLTPSAGVIRPTSTMSTDSAVAT